VLPRHVFPVLVLLSMGHPILFAVLPLWRVLLKISPSGIHAWFDGTEWPRKGMFLCQFVLEAVRGALEVCVSHAEMRLGAPNNHSFLGPQMVVIPVGQPSPRLPVHLPENGLHPSDITLQVSSSSISPTGGNTQY
jgi:hypothetical protein